VMDCKQCNGSGTVKFQGDKIDCPLCLGEGKSEYSINDEENQKSTSVDSADDKAKRYVLYLKIIN